MNPKIKKEIEEGRKACEELFERPVSTKEYREIEDVLAIGTANQVLDREDWIDVDDDDDDYNPKPTIGMWIANKKFILKWNTKVGKVFRNIATNRGLLLLKRGRRLLRWSGGRCSWCGNDCGFDSVHNRHGLRCDKCKDCGDAEDDQLLKDLDAI